MLEIILYPFFLFSLNFKFLIEQNCVGALLVGSVQAFAAS